MNQQTTSGGHGHVSIADVGFLSAPCSYFESRFIKELDESGYTDSRYH
jgi:hypothetical protein